MRRPVELFEFCTHFSVKDPYGAAAVLWFYAACNKHFLDPVRARGGEDNIGPATLGIRVIGFQQGGVSFLFRAGAQMLLGHSEC